MQRSISTQFRLITAGLLCLAVMPVGLTALARQGQAVPIIDSEAAPLPLEVAPTDPAIRFIGRFDTSDSAGPRCSWTASSVRLRFRGSALNVKLNDAGGNFYEVLVDAAPSAVLKPAGGPHIYQVFHADVAGEHTAELVKRTEGFCGVTQLQGFQLSEGGKLLTLPARAPHRIEVIGDSISCGYGNEGKDQNEHFSPDTENGYLAYGAVAAREVGADYVCIAWSGRKMWPDNTIDDVYGRTLAADPNSQWDFSRWKPDAVVVALCTNDWGKAAPDRKGWTDGYKTFLARVRKSYPKAAIYCATSPMMFGDGFNAAKSYLMQIVKDENDAGDKSVRLLEFTTQDIAANGIGADWHPSVKTDRSMGDKLAAALQADLGWKPAAAH